MSNFLPDKKQEQTIELNGYQVDFIIKAIDEQIDTLDHFKKNTLASAKIIEPSGIEKNIEEQIKVYKSWKKQFNELKKNWG
jgi:hypothetical protein